MRKSMSAESAALGEKWTWRKKKREKVDHCVRGFVVGQQSVQEVAYACKQRRRRRSRACLHARKPPKVRAATLDTTTTTTQLKQTRECHSANVQDLSRKEAGESVVEGKKEEEEEATAAAAAAVASTTITIITAAEQNPAGKGGGKGGDEEERKEDGVDGSDKEDGGRGEDGPGNMDDLLARGGNADDVGLIVQMTDLVGCWCSPTPAYTRAPSWLA